MPARLSPRYAQVIASGGLAGLMLGMMAAGMPVKRVALDWPLPPKDASLLAVNNAPQAGPEANHEAVRAIEEDLLEAAPVTQPAPPAPVAPALLVPVAGIAVADLQDTFTDSRAGGHRHDAIDILAPEGTKVRAVAAGRVVKLFTSKPGGLTVYQFDEREQYSYYYAHLQTYAADLTEGQWLNQGDAIGTVGHTGNASADAPHLHFAITKLNADKRWWQGEAVNPYPLLLSGEAPPSSPDDMAKNY